jgi:hypothetical protein
MTQAELAQNIFTLLGAGGGLAIAVQAGRAIFKWLSGGDARRRMRRKSAEQERDEADAYRRVIAEYASGLIRQLREAGLEPPPWPRNPNDPPHKERS